MKTKKSGVRRGLTPALAGLCALGAASCAVEGDDSSRVQQRAGQQGGFVFIVGDDADDTGHCQGTACGGLYVNMLREAVARSRSGGTGILAVGISGTTTTNARTGLLSWNNPANGGPNAPITYINTAAAIAAVNFRSYAVVYIPSDSVNTSGGLNAANATALNGRRTDLATFVNEQGGSFIVLTQAGQAASLRYGFLPVALTTEIQDYSDVTGTPELFNFSPSSTNTNLDHGSYHNTFTGPAGFSGLKGCRSMSLGDGSGRIGRAV